MMVSSSSRSRTTITKTTRITVELATAVSSNMTHQTTTMPKVTKVTIITAGLAAAPKATTKTCNTIPRQAMISTVISHSKGKIHSTLPGETTTISQQ